MNLKLSRILPRIKTAAEYIHKTFLLYKTQSLRDKNKPVLIIAISVIMLFLCTGILLHQRARYYASLDSLLLPETVPAEDDPDSAGGAVFDEFSREDFLFDNFFPDDEYASGEFSGDEYLNDQINEASFNFSATDTNNISLDANGFLVRYSNDGDVFTILSPEKFSTVLGDETFFVKNKYDDHFRITSRTVWQKANDPEAHMVSRAFFFYTNSAKKTVSRSEVYFFKTNTLEITKNAPDGLPVLVTKSYTKESEEDPNTLELTLFSETTYAYDTKRRIQEKTTRMLAPHTDAASTTSADKTEKIRYTYTNKADAPNVEIYRNDVLTTWVEHEANGTYTETRALSSQYSVQTRYEQDTLVGEIYLSNGKEIRRNQ